MTFLRILFVAAVGLGLLLVVNCSGPQKTIPPAHYIVTEAEMDALMGSDTLDSEGELLLLAGQPFSGTVRAQGITGMLSVVAALASGIEQTKLYVIENGVVVGDYGYHKLFGGSYVIVHSAVSATSTGGKTITSTDYIEEKGRIYAVRATVDYVDSEVDRKEEITFYHLPFQELPEFVTVTTTAGIVEETNWSLNGKVLTQKKNGKAVPVMLDGTIEVMDAEGYKAVKQYEKGKQVGEEFTYYENGDLHSKRDVSEGYYRRYWANGELSLEAEVAEGRLHGPCTTYYETGEVWRTYTYWQDKKNGKWTAMYRNGEVGKVGFYVLGSNTGPTYEYYDTGKKWKEITITAMDSDSTTHYVSWYTNGNMAEDYEMVNDRKQGLYQQWWENGVMRLRVDYYNGIEHGHYQNWEDSGDLVKDEYRYMGKSGNKEQFDYQMEQMVDYRTDSKSIITGTDTVLTYTSWYKNGKMSAKHTLVNRKMEGVAEAWHNNGQARQKTNYKDGKRHGQHQEWGPTASKQQNTWFFDGVEVLTKAAFDYEAQHFAADRLETEAVELTNRFEVTRKQAESWGLPEVAFSLSYPSGLKVEKASAGQDNDNYISLVASRDRSKEELTIGWCNVPTTMIGGAALLRQISSNFYVGGSKAKEEFLGEADFAGKKLPQVHLTYAATDDVTGEKQRWKMLLVIYPSPTEGTVLLLFQANHYNQEIKSFSDFGDNGITGQVWQSFVME